MKETLIKVVEHFLKEYSAPEYFFSFSCHRKCYQLAVNFNRQAAYFYAESDNLEYYLNEKHYNFSSYDNVLIGGAIEITQYSDHINSKLPKYLLTCWTTSSWMFNQSFLLLNFLNSSTVDHVIYNYL